MLMLGSGGLSIGQAGEFDYSGSQAIKALKVTLPTLAPESSRRSYGVRTAFIRSHSYAVPMLIFLNKNYSQKHLEL